ncbi:MAG TPA: DUF6600 domain-containing protein [Vicinamibacteria bacterium]|nr:DUF6600 domain-containing protein [Vicinamibacteria bacterium]
MSWFRALRALLLSLVLGLLAGASTTAAPLTSGSLRGQASLEVNVGLFHDDLEPYGEWIDNDEYGRAWVPRVGHDWRPYTRGRWVWTDDYGWLWVSDEDFGWAVFHYGRWIPDPRYGWVWIPGNEWAPAWVAWRSGGGYIGWAPLPPRATWEVGLGFRVGAAQIDAWIAPQHYCFVEERAFVDPAIHRRILPASHAPSVITLTRNVTSYSAAGGRVVNRGLSVEQVQRLTGREVPRARAVEVDSIKAARHARIRGGEVPVFRPAARERSDRTPPGGRALSRKEPGGAPPSAPTLGPEARDRERRREVRSDGETRRQLAKQQERESQDSAKRHVQPQKEQEQQRRVLAQQHQGESREAERRLVQQQKEQEQQRRVLAQQHERESREAERRLVQQHARDERQRQELEKRQARERDTVERQHRAELKHPARDVPVEEIERRQVEQHRALEERQHSERQQQQAAREQARQQREAQVAGSKRTVQAPAEARKEGPRRAPGDHQDSKKKDDKPKGPDRP